MAKSATITTNISITISILPYFLLLVLSLDNHEVVFAFLPSVSMRSTIGDNDLLCRVNLPTAFPQPRSLSSSSLSSTTNNHKSLSGNTIDIHEMKSLGEKKIIQAALQCGATEPMICIEWKTDRIVVTVDISRDDDYLGQLDNGITNDDDDDDDDDDIMLDFLVEGGEVIMYDDDDEVEFDADDIIDDMGDEFDDSRYEATFESESEFNSNRIDLSRIARTINELLAQDGEDSLSYTIAKLHEIEVTTPEFDNVLRGKRMFESYKGFDVTVEYWEEGKEKKQKAKVKSKSHKDSHSDRNTDSYEDDENNGGVKPLTKQKLKIAEGKLVGRDYEKEITLINIKGRVTKIRNDMIERVCLPKAKREKGVR